MIAFFILEKVLHWHHAHYAHEEVVHPIAVTNLVGDGLHNFVDGSIIAASFLASTELGIATRSRSCCTRSRRSSVTSRSS